MVWSWQNMRSALVAITLASAASRAVWRAHLAHPLVTLGLQCSSTRWHECAALLATTLMLLAQVHTSRGGVLPPHRAALVDLYNSTGGPTWSESSGWLVGDPCFNQIKWHGVDCDSTGSVL